MKNITELKNIRGKRVMVRGSLNVPIKDGKVANDFRLRMLLPTLEYLRDAGAKIILVGHVSGSGGDTLRPVYEYLKDLKDLKKKFPVEFVKNFLNPDTTETINKQKEGGIVLFENLRIEAGEKENSEAFAKQLAGYVDYFVADAFPAAHRRHASIVSVPRLLPSFAGVQFAREVTYLSNARTPARPALFILGGDKFGTKLPLAKAFLPRMDNIFIGGALANEFFKCEGYEMGGSATSGEPCDIQELLASEKLLLPIDVGGPGFTKRPEEVTNEDCVLDLGPESVELLREVVAKSASVLWNGPLGDYLEGFTAHNEAVAKSIAESDAESVVGGGDTIASIERLGLEKSFTFLSTAGGAMIDFLADGTLPGIEALDE